MGTTEDSAESQSVTADTAAAANAAADAVVANGAAVGQPDEQDGTGIDEVAQTDTVIDDYSADYSDDYSDDYLDDYSDDSNVDAEDVVVDEPGLDYDVATDYGLDERVGDEVPIEEPGIDYDFEYTEEENIQVDDPFDLPLDEEGIDEDEEEQEEVDINIDEGFLEDNAGNAVDLPVVETRGAVQNAPVQGGNTFIFFFCALGGTNDQVNIFCKYFMINLYQGSVNVVDLLNTGLGNAAQSLSIAPLPSQVLAAFINACTQWSENYILSGSSRRQYVFSLHQRSNHDLQPGFHHPLPVRVHLQARQLLRLQPDGQLMGRHRGKAHILPSWRHYHQARQVEWLYTSTPFIHITL